MDVVTEQEPRSGADIAVEMAATGALDEVFVKIVGDLDVTGAEGFIPGLVKAALERACRGN